VEEPQFSALKEIIRISLKVSDSPEKVGEIFEQSSIDLSTELVPQAFLKPETECLKSLIVNLSQFPIARISAKKIFFR